MPAELLPQLPYLLLIIFLASAIQGATGFGFGLFAVAALTLLVPLKTATPLLAVLNAPVVFYVLWKLRRHVPWRGLAPIIGGTLVGIPLGIHVLVHWRQDILLRVLGVVLLVAAWFSLRGNRAHECEVKPDSPRAGAALGVGVGLATGALGGAFNTAGPPLVAYVYCRPWSKEQRVGTLQAVFALSVVTRIALMSAAGLYQRDVLLTSAACLPATLLGMWAGYALFRRLPHRALEGVAAGFLLLIGLKLLIWA